MSQLTQLAENIREDILRAGSTQHDQWSDHTYPDDPHLLAGLSAAEILLRATYDLVHDLDLALSGDTCVESLQKHLAEWHKKNRQAIHSALKLVDKTTK